MFTKEGMKIYNAYRNMEDCGDNAFEDLRYICALQYRRVLMNVGRFIPPSLASKYPLIKTPSMHAMYHKSGEKLSIDEIVKINSKRSVMIIGCGGSGKTYTLIEFIGKLLTTEMNTLPFYIPLNDFNSNTNTIIKYVEQLCEEYICDSEVDFRKCLMKWSGFECDKEILFFLDGFNEITSDDTQIRVLEEIKKLQSLYCCIRFVMTSRYDMSGTMLSGAVSPFVSYVVDELSSETVKDYIRSFFDNYGNADRIIANAMVVGSDGVVKEFLRNPMALVMYCFMNCENTSEFVIPHKDYCTIGELVDNYVFLIKKLMKRSMKRINLHRCF